MALLPLLAESVWGGGRGLPASDYAAFELDVRRALSGEQLLGPYSRYGWRHPGPLYAYVAVPLYALSGQRSASLYFSAALINLASVCGILLCGWGASRSPTWRLLLALATGLLILSARDQPHQLSPLTDLWNPVVPLLPYALLNVVALRIALGARWLLPLAALLWAFVVQTHVGFGPPATFLGLTAVVLCWRELRRRGQRVAELWWPLSAAVGVAALAWLPPLFEQLRETPGNISKLVSFFGQRSGAQPWGDVADYAAFHLAQPFASLIGVASPSAASSRTLLAVLAALLVLVLGVGLVVGRRLSSERSGRVLLVLVAPQVAVFVLSLRAIPDELPSHVALWGTVIAVMTWLGAAAVLRDSERAAASPRRVRAFGLAALALLCFAASSSGVRTVQAYRDVSAPFDRAVLAATTTVESALAAPRPHRLTLRGPLREWTLFGALVLQLKKRGYRPLLAPRMKHIFGTGFDYAERAAADVIFTVRPMRPKPGTDLIGRYPPLLLYRRWAGEPP